jgi:hypothetical protein
MDPGVESSVIPGEDEGDGDVCLSGIVEKTDIARQKPQKPGREI